MDSGRINGDFYFDEFDVLEIARPSLADVGVAVLLVVLVIAVAVAFYGGLAYGAYRLYLLLP